MTAIAFWVRLAAMLVALLSHVAPPGPTVAAAPPPAVHRPPPVAGTPAIPAVWACIAQRESGGNPREDTGNGYYGAYQFSGSTWASMGSGYARADLAPEAVQLVAAEALQRRAGWGQWPVTSRECGA